LVLLQQLAVVGHVGPDQVVQGQGGLGPDRGDRGLGGGEDVRDVAGREHDLRLFVQPHGRLGLPLDLHPGALLPLVENQVVQRERTDLADHVDQRLPRARRRGGRRGRGGRDRRRRGGGRGRRRRGCGRRGRRLG